MIATITINPSIDQHWIVPDLHKDDTNRAVQVIHTAGGKGANVSKVIRELGGPTHAYSLVGGQMGAYWKSLMRQLDIPYSAQTVLGQTRVNTVISDVKDRTQTRISAPGPKMSQKDIRRFLKKLLGVRPQPAYWALGGSLAPGLGEATYHQLVTALQRDGGRCVLDTDGAALRIGIRARPFMIKPNEHELERLLGRSFQNLDQYVKAGRELVRRQGITIAVISLAAKGALFITSSQTLHVRPPQVTVKSKIGAGDSLIGGFLLGLCRGKNLRQAAELGVAASVSAVSREAPRLCWKADVGPLLSRMRTSIIA